MKKRIFAIFACFIFTAAMMTGCKKAPVPETPDTSVPAAEADALLIQNIPSFRMISLTTEWMMNDLTAMMLSKTI